MFASPDQKPVYQVVPVYPAEVVPVYQAVPAELPTPIEEPKSAVIDDPEELADLAQLVEEYIAPCAHVLCLSKLIKSPSDVQFDEDMNEFEEELKRADFPVPSESNTGTVVSDDIGFTKVSKKGKRRADAAAEREKRLADAAAEREKRRVAFEEREKRRADAAAEREKSSAKEHKMPDCHYKDMCKFANCPYGHDLPIEDRLENLRLFRAAQHTAYLKSQKEKKHNGEIRDATKLLRNFNQYQTKSGPTSSFVASFNAVSDRLKVPGTTRRKVLAGLRSLHKQAADATPLNDLVKMYVVAVPPLAE